MLRPISTLDRDMTCPRCFERLPHWWKLAICPGCYAKTLRGTRRNINAIDSQILDLLKSRIGLARRAMELRGDNDNARDYGRESDVAARYVVGLDGHASGGRAAMIALAIIDAGVYRDNA